MIADNIDKSKKEKYTLQKIVEKKVPTKKIISSIILTISIIIINKIYLYYLNKIMLYILAMLFVITILLYKDIFKYFLNTLLNKRIINKLKKSSLLEEINLECENLELNEIKSGKYLGFINLKSYSIVFENILKVFKYGDIKRVFVYSAIRRVGKSPYSIIELNNGKNYRITGNTYYDDIRKLAENNDLNIIYKKNILKIIKYNFIDFLKLILILIIVFFIMIKTHLFGI